MLYLKDNIGSVALGGNTLGEVYKGSDLIFRKTHIYIYTPVDILSVGKNNLNNFAYLDDMNIFKDRVIARFMVEDKSLIIGHNYQHPIYPKVILTAPKLNISTGNVSKAPSLQANNCAYPNGKIVYSLENSTTVNTISNYHAHLYNSINVNNQVTDSDGNKEIKHSEITYPTLSELIMEILLYHSSTEDNTVLDNILNIKIKEFDLYLGATTIMNNASSCRKQSNVMFHFERGLLVVGKYVEYYVTYLENTNANNPLL